jgi:hypothetical protein
MERGIDMTEPKKKSFHPAFMCAIIPTNFVIIAIIGIAIGVGTTGYRVSILIGALYTIAAIPLSIITFVKIGKYVKEKRKAERIQASAPLHAPIMSSQPSTWGQPAQQAAQGRQSSQAMDSIYAKGLERVADEIVQQIMPKPAPTSAAPASVPQASTTVAASKSMVVKPVAKTTTAIPMTTPEAVAAKRAMLERVLAPQSSNAQALASDVMGSIASTKAVKGMKKDGGQPGEAATSKTSLDKTEEEVTTIKEQRMCVVHKGPIAGANFLCPKCETFYCMKCAIALKKNGEKCWSCGAEIVVDIPETDA